MLSSRPVLHGTKQCKDGYDRPDVFVGGSSISGYGCHAAKCDLVEFERSKAIAPLQCNIFTPAMN